MIIATITVSGNCTSVDLHYPLTRGLTGATVVFDCSPEWENLVKTVTWHTRSKDLEIVLVDTSKPVEIPAEICQNAGLEVLVGLTGKDDTGAIKIPTVWSSLKQVQRSGAPAEHFEPTPGWSDQIEGGVQRAIDTANEALHQVEDNKPLTERAEAAAQAAEASAAGSAASAGAARQAEANAQAARDTAVKAAGAAGSSATAAESAQRAAANSSGQAGESAQASAQSAAQAQTAQEAADASADLAKGSELAAHDAFNRANGSAQAASDDAQRAKTAAAAAEDSEAAALASQQAAETAASAASTSAGTASQQARAAAGSAEEAGSDAATAAQAAQTATEQAQASTTQADRAKQEAGKAAQAALDAQMIIDDGAVSDKKTQSSLKLYDSLCLPFEKTGPIVTCHPVENYPLQVVSQIAVRQEGSGDPSPSNVRPIVMTDKVELVRCGKNLFDPKPKLIGLFYAYSAQFLKKGIRYKILATSNIPYLKVAKNKDAVDLVTVTDIMANVPKVFSVSKEITPEYFIFLKQDSGWASETDPLTADISIVPESLENVSGYIGETYTAQLPKPVAGGVVDWTAKKIVECPVMQYTTEPRDVKILAENSNDESTLFYFSVEQPYGSTARFDGTGNAVSYDTEVTYVSNTTNCYGLNDGYRRLVYVRLRKDTGVETIDQFDEWATRIDLQLLLPVNLDTNTPEDIVISGAPLDPPGTSNLYSSTGDTTVSGRQDPVYTAENLISRVTALENKEVKEI